MPERPDGLPADAVWSPSDNEWVLAPTDDDGKNHGVVTYWRPDGTLVNHCEYKNGTPHGWYKRYHQSGEVSRQGNFVDGRLHGTDEYFRSDQPTTENFPSGLSERVWRAEMDMRRGAIVGARAYDRDGAQVSETGEPFPPRPETVPETAGFSSQGGRWLVGETDDEFERHGLWRFFSKDGALEQEVEYDHGTELENRVYESAAEAAIEVAMREGRAAEAVSAAEAEWTAAGESVDALVIAGDLLLRALDGSSAGEPRQEEVARAISEAFDGRPLHWGVFMASGKKRFLALGRALLVLARTQRLGGHGDDALATIDRAIAADSHYGTAALRVERYRILKSLGRDDEAFQVARAALSLDKSIDGLEDVAASPEFKTWLDSISADKMTTDGAREVLGSGGDGLLRISAPILRDADDDDEEDDDDDDDLDAALVAMDDAWPIADALGDRLSPELRTWIDLDLSERIEDTYRGAYYKGVDSSVAGAVEAQDGTWIARLQSVFLPASAILVEDEQFWLATWHPTSAGNSRVYYQHQDEPEMSRSSASIAGFIVDRLLGDTGYEELTIPAATREQWQRAAQLDDEADQEGFPKHLDIDALEPRTIWIIDFLLGIQIGDGFENAPTMDTWTEERELTFEWPHLQAYWLFHHIVFDNREELAELCERCNRRYPAVAELVAIGKSLASGEEPATSLIEAAKALGLRAQALDTGHETLLSDAAQARSRKALAARDAANAAMNDARKGLEAAGDATVAEVLDLWDLLESSAGNISAYEEALCQQAFDNQDDSMSYFMRQRTGHVSILGRVMMSFGDKIDDTWKNFFEAAMLRGAEMSEEHTSAIPGALFGYTLATGDFKAAMKTIAGLPFYSDHFGRRRRLEMTLAAEKLWDQTAAQNYLVREAERFAPQFSDWETDTVITNTFILIAKDHPKGPEIFNGMMANASFSGANWKSAIGLCTELGGEGKAALAPGLKAAVDAGLGRHDDGDRGPVIRAYAVSAGKESIPVLEEMLGSTGDVRKDCERAAILSALIAVDGDNSRWHDEAQSCLGALLAGRMGSMQFGAAVTLLQALRESPASGFADLATSVWERGKEDDHAKEPLLAWLDEHKGEL